MRRFVFTSKQFKGYAESIYYINGILWRIDFSHATGITAKYIYSLKNMMPVQVENVLEAFAPYSDAIKIEEKDFEVTFEDFKREYPSSRNNFRAEPPWNRKKSSEQYIVLIAAIEYKKYCSRNAHWGYKPMGADRFINDEQYKNKWAEL